MPIGAEPRSPADSAAYFDPLCAEATRRTAARPIWGNLEDHVRPQQQILPAPERDRSGREHHPMHRPRHAQLRFIDLFAGLGGFHLALQALGHQCVFASELDHDLAKLYARNFGIEPLGDIRDIDPVCISHHDVLCAGLPCQPFSKAGEQRGLRCPKWGDLVDFVVSILKIHRPKYFIIENVPNIVKHEYGRTWRTIHSRLNAANYSVAENTISPHEFGVPHLRPRTFILGSTEDLTRFQWPQPSRTNEELSIILVLDKAPPEARRLPQQSIAYLDAWQQFLNLYPQDEELPSFPIWSMEFGANYPFETTSPYGTGFSNLQSYNGGFGKPLRDLPPAEIIQSLPSYARVPTPKFPQWKINFIRQNRELYKRNKSWIDCWLPSIHNFAPSYQKFEWNCKGEKRSIWSNVIQFRASGIRVKRPTSAPSLVAMTTSQVPIIGWERRFMTIRECSRLQSMDALNEFPQTNSAAFKALGNAVNVEVVKQIASGLFRFGDSIESIGISTHPSDRGTMSSSTSEVDIGNHQKL